MKWSRRQKDDVKLLRNTRWLHLKSTVLALCRASRFGFGFEIRIRKVGIRNRIWNTLDSISQRLQFLLVFNQKIDQIGAKLHFFKLQLIFCSLKSTKLIILRDFLYILFILIMFWVPKENSKVDKYIKTIILLMIL